MIAENINILIDDIKETCLKCGRDPGEVRLIAVSKNTGLDLIRQARNAGLVMFGESRAQELSEKASLLGPDFQWHFIGHLQKNKAKFVVPVAEAIHSVDSEELASEINKHAVKAGKIQNVLIEVKTSGEETKQGIEGYEKLMDLARFTADCTNLKLCGLMTIAPFTDDVQLVRKSFSELAHLKNQLNGQGFGLTELSMGMTGDYRIAIEEGATMIRVGTAIFGQRDYSKSWKEQ
ncbi:MAG: YggS family pyridoxal phosphate-dependent enzyme [Bacteroidota bacterium]